MIIWLINQFNQFNHYLDSYRYKIDDPINAFIRLTPDATLYFENLSFKEKSSFSQILMHQLAEIIPIPDDRIIFNGYQKDSTVLNQMFISIKILESKNNSVINASMIIDNLDTLIKKKEITSISKYNLTSMLDESYGLKAHGE